MLRQGFWHEKKEYSSVLHRVLLFMLLFMKQTKQKMKEKQSLHSCRIRVNVISLHRYLNKLLFKDEESGINKDPSIIRN